MNQAIESVKLDRKIVERNRRIHMKGLCFKLASLIPACHVKSSQQDVIDEATAYIKKLKESVEELKMRKELVMRSGGSSNSRSEHPPGSISPAVELRLLDSDLGVTLISGMDRNFTLSEAISILEEEGAEAMCTSVSTIGDKVFHTIHAQVRFLRVGVETSRVYERLHQLVYSF